MRRPTCLTIEYARRRRPEILRKRRFEAGRAASRLRSVFGGMNSSFPKRAFEIGEVRVHAPLDSARAKRSEHGCHTGQLDVGLKVNDRDVAFGGEAVVVKERRRPGSRPDDELARALADQDFEVVLDLASG